MTADINDMAWHSRSLPFANHLADGRTLEVRHPEFLAVPLEGKRFVYMGHGSGIEVVALDMVVSLKTLDTNIRADKQGGM